MKTTTITLSVPFAFTAGQIDPVQVETKDGFVNPENLTVKTASVRNEVNRYVLTNKHGDTIVITEFPVILKKGDIIDLDANLGAVAVRRPEEAAGKSAAECVLNPGADFVRASRDLG